MGFIVVYRTLAKLFKAKRENLLYGILYVSFFFVSYNRAQQQVHSFDQLVDGFAMGMIMSEYLTEPEVQEYFKKLVQNIRLQTYYQVMTSSLCKVYYGM